MSSERQLIIHTIDRDYVICLHLRCLRDVPPRPPCFPCAPGRLCACCLTPGSARWATLRVLGLLAAGIACLWHGLDACIGVLHSRGVCVLVLLAE